MHPDKVIQKLTEEILNEFLMPRSLCQQFIHDRINQAWAAGYDKGREQKHHWRQVAQFDMDGEFVHYYESVKQASQRTNISRRSISDVCLGHKPSVKGFTFQYVNGKSPH